MKRAKKHRIKHEIPETSTARVKDSDEHDLAYYIHDRVDLMHQVFSVIKPKELKSLAPECVRHISLDDLQELCTEELLGISSKRLCAILDGAEPPSDTESSSSSPELETISLDSISSDDEILSQPSSKGKKHKHKKHGKSKGKHKRHSSKQDEEKSNENEDQSKATRAGLTVLELLELQARARAIRAQLQRDQQRSPDPIEETKPSHSDDEVEIKEEPAEVVEISSDEEKPNVKELEDKLTNKESQGHSNKVTKRINDLIITVPQTKQLRKIKLNRPKAVATEECSKDNDTIKETPKEVEIPKEKEVKKKKQKKKQRKEKDSDHDEITLQLSDTEKMDLLEDFDRKNYDAVTTSEDSESSSETNSDSSNSSQGNVMKNDKKKDSTKKKQVNESDTNKNPPICKSNDVEKEPKVKNKIDATDSENTKEKPVENIINENDSENSLTNKNLKNYDGINKLKDEERNDKDTCDAMNISTEILFATNIIIDDKMDEQIDRVYNENKSSEDIDLEKEKKDSEVFKGKEMSNNLNVISEQNEAHKEEDKNKNTPLIDIVETNNNGSSPKDTDAGLNVIDSITKMNSETNIELNNSNNMFVESVCGNTNEIDVEEGEIHSNKDLSDGEISEHQAEIVCISDEEVKKKKKKKKEKKSKNEKSDFRKGADQNFFRENKEKENLKKEPEIVVINDEIFELSDDSSCFEVGGVNVLSEEPTTEEIVALSAKIDDTIDREANEEEQDIEMSWKDRYLDSTKVKKVLSTSNILNALRKKNKELKRKLEEKKLKDLEEENYLKNAEEEHCAVPENLVEGSMDHYNTLEGSNKYVDPIVEKPQVTTNISREMEKDAKQLLKMYKKLLKYNDMNRQKDPSKKKKKKAKKKKDKENKEK